MPDIDVPDELVETLRKLIERYGKGAVKAALKSASEIPKRPPGRPRRPKYDDRPLLLDALRRYREHDGMSVWAAVCATAE